MAFLHPKRREILLSLSAVGESGYSWSELVSRLGDGGILYHLNLLIYEGYIEKVGSQGGRGGRYRITQKGLKALECARSLEV